MAWVRWCGMMLIGFLVFGSPAPASITLGSAAAIAAESNQDDMARVRLILKKLRDAMGSMKDFDELEAAGMPKKDVQRMRNAMNQKIQQMMNDAMQAIQQL